MHHADLLVSDSDAPFDEPMNERSAEAWTLVGREYALVGSEYEYSPSHAARRAGPKRLLVSYGGSDGTGETMKALGAVRSLRADAATSDTMGRVDVVVGQLNPIAEEIARAARGGSVVCLLRRPADRQRNAAPGALSHAGDQGPVPALSHDAGRSLRAEGRLGHPRAAG